MQLPTKNLPLWSADLRLQQADVLQHEVAELRKENKHLREVLRILLAPPVYRGEATFAVDLSAEDARQQCRDILAKLEEQGKQQDAVVLEMAAAQEKLKQQHRARVREAIAKWSGHGSQWLMREVFSAWKNPMQLAQQGSLFASKLEKAKVSEQKKLARLLIESAASNAKVVLAAWLAAAKSQSLEVQTQQKRQERIQNLMLGWSGETRVMQAICLQSWLRVWRDAREEKREAKLRKEHKEVAEALRREAVLKSVFALSTSQAKEADEVSLRFIIVAWRDVAFSERKMRAMASEADRLKASQARAEAQAKRQCMLLMVETEKGQVAMVFGAWRDRMQQSRQVKLVNDLKYLQWAWRAWARDFEQRGLERRLAAEQDRAAKEDADADAQRKLRKRTRDIGLAFSIITKSETQQAQMLLHLMWSAWQEHVSSAKQARQRELEIAAMREEMLRHQAELQRLEQRRGVAFAWAGAGKSGEENNTLLLQAVLSAWCGHMQEVRRARNLDSRQALFEFRQRAEQLQTTGLLKPELADVWKAWRLYTEDTKLYLRIFLLRRCWSKWRQFTRAKGKGAKCGCGWWTPSRRSKRKRVTVSAPSSSSAPSDPSRLPLVDPAVKREEATGKSSFCGCMPRGKGSKRVVPPH